MIADIITSTALGGAVLALLQWLSILLIRERELASDETESS